MDALTDVGTAEALPWPVELDPVEVLERFRWARRRGHPRYLWPDVPPPSLRRALAELTRVTAAVLRGDLPSVSVESVEDLRALGVAGFTSGLGPLLGHWIETGRVRSDPSVGRLFRFHLGHGRARAWKLRGELERASSALHAVGVTPLVMKGVHTAPAYFPEPGTRPAMDVDMAVPPGTFDAAENALRRAGYTVAVRGAAARGSDERTTVLLAPSASRLPRSLEVFHADSQYVIDLHESLGRRFPGAGSVHPTRLTAETGRPAPELNAPVRVLGQPELLLYHVLHVSHDFRSLTLIRIVELVLMIRQDEANGALDWEAFRSLTEERNAGRFCYPAMRAIQSIAPRTVPGDVLEWISARTPPRVRRVVDRLDLAEAQPLEKVAMDEKFMWCSSPAEYLRRIANMLVLGPGEDRLRRFGRVYRDRLYSLLRGAVSWSRTGR